MTWTETETAATYTTDPDDGISRPPERLCIIGRPNAFVLERRLEILEKVTLPPLLERLGRADYQMWIRLNAEQGRVLAGYAEAVRQHNAAMEAVAAEVAEIARLQTELEATRE